MTFCSFFVCLHPLSHFCEPMKTTYDIKISHIKNMYIKREST